MHHKMDGRTWIVPKDHPYCTGGNHIPEAYRVGNEWKIAWRSFDSMKQDHTYPSEQKAREVARSIADKPVMANAGDENQLKEFSALWIEAAGLPASIHSRFTFSEMTDTSDSTTRH